MAGPTASTAPGQDPRFASARAEIDDFMRRFLAYAKTDNAAARAAPKIVLRNGQLTSADLTQALEKLDILCSRLDVEATNVIQIEIQNEALKSLHQDRVRHYAETVQELEQARLALEVRCRELELRLQVATRVGGRLGSAKLARLLGREKRIARRHAARPLPTAPQRSETLIAAE